MRDDSQIVEDFKDLSTGVLGDSLLRLGLFRHASGILPIGGSSKLCGRAFTVRYRSASLVAPGDVGDYIDDVPQGYVVVIDNSGRVDCTVWGDILTLAAMQRSLGGTVIDGACRDSTRAVEEGYPLFARASTMRTGKGQVEVSSVDDPVSLGAAHVAPGDLIFGDRDGICVVPWAHVHSVLEAAQEIQGREHDIEGMVRDGASLAEARRRHGYFNLQDPDALRGG